MLYLMNERSCGLSLVREASQTNHRTVLQQLKLKHAQVLLSPANNEGPAPQGDCGLVLTKLRRLQTN